MNDNETNTGYKKGDIIKVTDPLIIHLGDDYAAVQRAQESVHTMYRMALSSAHRELWDKIEASYPEAKILYMSYDSEDHTLIIMRDSRKQGNSTPEAEVRAGPPCK